MDKNNIITADKIDHKFVKVNKLKIIIIVLVLFTLLYMILFNTTEGFNNRKTNILETCIDGVYFSTTTIATIGYGDIVPIKYWSKFIVSLEHILLIYLTYFSIA